MDSNIALHHCFLFLETLFATCRLECRKSREISWFSISWNSFYFPHVSQGCVAHLQCEYLFHYTNSKCYIYIRYCVVPRPVIELRNFFFYLFFISAQKSHDFVLTTSVCRRAINVGDLHTPITQKFAVALQRRKNWILCCKLLLNGA